MKIIRPLSILAAVLFAATGLLLTGCPPRAVPSRPGDSGQDLPSGWALLIRARIEVSTARILRIWWNPGERPE